MIRLALAVAVIASVAVRARAAEEIQKFYYVGDMKLCSASGKPMGSQVFLIEKTHDPARGLITERAVVVGPDGKAVDFVMDMRVTGNSFSLSGREGNVKGAGELFGPPWHWTYFKARYQSSNGVRVEDENFMTDPTVITARKKVSSPDGTVLTYMEGSFKAITPQTFQMLTAALLGRAKARPASRESK